MELVCAISPPVVLLLGDSLCPFDPSSWSWSPARLGLYDLYVSNNFKGRYPEEDIIPDTPSAARFTFSTALLTFLHLLHDPELMLRSVMVETKAKGQWWSNGADAAPPAPR